MDVLSNVALSKHLVPSYVSRVKVKLLWLFLAPNQTVKMPALLFMPNIKNI